MYVWRVPAAGVMKGQADVARGIVRGDHAPSAGVFGLRLFPVLQRNRVVIRETPHEPFAQLIVVAVHPHERHPLGREVREQEPVLGREEIMFQ